MAQLVLQVLLYNQFSSSPSLHFPQPFTVLDYNSLFPVFPWSPDLIVSGKGY